MSSSPLPLDATPLALTATGVIAFLLGVGVAALLFGARAREMRRRHHSLEQQLAGAREDIETLTPQARQALGLESALNVKQAELGRLREQRHAQYEDLQRRLRDTEAMAGSMQDALLEARREVNDARASLIAAGASTLAAMPSPATDARGEDAPGAGAASSDDPAERERLRRLEQLSMRLTEIARAAHKWQRGGAR